LGKSNRNDEENKQKKRVLSLFSYPNVGKSSTINALMQAKRVAVSETPGKTKHYQVIINKRILNKK
jgi:large subunit GTPase 1